MKLYRSMLFVPGHRPAWISKAAKYGADALLLDLEDGVPIAEKVAARATVRAGIAELRAQGVATFVRVNALDTGLTSDDIEAIVAPGLAGVMVPKIETAAEVTRIDAWLEHFERKAGMPIGAVEILAMPETALGMQNAPAIATASPRIGCVANGIGARSGDVTKAIGYKWTPQGLEMLHIMSHILLANRAAGIEYPLSAGVLEVKDLDQVRRQMQRLREIGYRGMVLIHPSAIPIANELFAPGADEVEWHKGVLRAVAEAEKVGSSAVTFDGMMVDYAHVRNALDLLKQAQDFGMDVGEYPRVKAL
jgi:citrate lyase subunit beta/citryl-CoA lyase